MPDGGVLTLDDIAGLKADLDRVSGDVKNFAVDILAKVKAGQDVTAELKTKVDEALIEANANRQAIIDKLVADMAAVAARTDDLEQKAARRGSGEGGAAGIRSPGQLFIEDERVKGLLNDPDRSRWRGRMRANMAAITTVTAGATRDVLVPYDRIPGIVERPDRKSVV